MYNVQRKLILEKSYKNHMENYNNKVIILRVRENIIVVNVIVVQEVAEVLLGQLKPQPTSR
jgi:hypothetical protein